MSIITYKDGILAADTLISDGEYRLYYSNKIFKSFDNFLVGATGNTKYCLEFIEWAMNKNRFETNAPKTCKFGDSGILIHPNGDIHIYSGKNCEKINDKVYAMGAGAPVAYGSFFMGATAKQAVEAAIKFNLFCGGDVTLLTL